MATPQSVLRCLSPAARLFAIAALAALAVASGPAMAADWPQWRGPRLDGTSAETGLPLSWTAEQNIAWKLAVPARSGATPVVADGRIYLSVSQDPEVDKELALWAVDAETGKLLWQRALGGGNELKYKQHMSSPSPVTDGQRVWVLTGTGIVKAFSRDGEELWSRDLQKEYGAFGLQWGYASSPLLFEDSLIIQVLHGMHTDDPSYVLRVDQATGKTRWRVERPTDAVRESPDAYTTPMVLERAGKQEIVIAGGDVVTGHDPATGRELWRVGGVNPERGASDRLVASPLVDGSRIFAFGKRGPIVALEASGEGTPKTLWVSETGTDVPTPVTDGRYLYVVNDSGIAHCFDAATGKIVWGPQRLATGTYSASPVLAEGRIYAINESGTTSVFRAAPEFELLATNPLDGYTLSSPAIADGRIYLRTDEFLYAVGERKRPAPAGS
jgi:outer membrane protein assembly factor BamB